MTIRYYAKGNYWFDTDTMEIRDKPGKYHTSAPVQKDGKTFIISDLPPYKSPVDGRVVDGRVARREDLKRNGCREVDPSEAKVAYSQEFAMKKGLPPPEREFRHLFR